jgi:hypothetical protein
VIDPNDPHDIRNEPQYLAEYYELDPSEQRAQRPERTTDQVERVEHTVWDEPTIASELSGQLEPDITYASWLSQNIAQTSWFDSWAVTVLVACAAGPWGVLGAFAGANATGFALLAMCVFGPIAEEVSKVAAAMWIVEKRPYCYLSGAQILFCAACGGLAFASIENLIYMYVYVPDHSREFVAFRWTVCVALHMSCSTMAGLGLVKVWRESITNLQKPRLELAYSWMATAMVCHGIYNFTVTILQLTGWLDLGMPESSP